MDTLMYEKCEKFILECRDILAKKDIPRARLLRIDATGVFADHIPRWSTGMMASVTGFYLDDVELILGKLLNFQKSINLP